MGAVNVTEGTGDTLVLSFPLRWDNSWRDPFNWDAAWVFFKYKSRTGDWNHVNLCSGGHKFINGSGQPVSFGSMPGKTGSNTVGLFIYRNALEVGNTPEVICQIKCLKSSLGNLTPKQFNEHQGFILTQALEMVYVPYGVYALGDGQSGNRFAGSSDGGYVWMDNEGLLNGSSPVKAHPVTNGVVGNSLTIGANYPKGYKGFYVMKYEVSQEQYVAFLNTLTYAQQQERIPGLFSLKGGEFVFGVKTAPNNRNGIIVNVVSDGGSPVVFANNLNNNAIYSEDGDGKTIACNYLSPSDMLVYCSWSGLRPMSELEYEKTGRPLYPEVPAKGGYAWNTTALNNRLSAVSNGGMRKELAQGGANVNSGGGSWRQGPVRNGIFATPSSTQESSGASFWGVMELSGNLREMCYNVNGNGAFDGMVLGDGTYNVGKWSVTPSYIGVRGGSFTGADSLLRTSDRTEVNYFSALTVNVHDSTVGFRGVRPIGNDVTVTQGLLVAKQGGVNINSSACPGVQIELMTDVPSRVMSGETEVLNMDFTYVWYVLKPGATTDSIIPGVIGEILQYNDLIVTGESPSVTYKFRRKAICPLGESMTDYITLTVLNMGITLNPTEASIDVCDNSVMATVKGYCSDPVYRWSYKDKWSKTGLTYKPSRTNFDGTGAFIVDVTVSSGGCISEKQGMKVYIPDVLEVNADQVTMDNCGNVVAIDPEDDKRYCTTKIGTQCWMGKNLDAGSFFSTATTPNNGWLFDKSGIQKWCYNNMEANCAVYGGLYEWWEAVCGGRCNDKLTTANAGVSLNSERELEAYGALMVPGSTTQVQGICPDGWHIAGNNDWRTLEISLGMSSATADLTGWRGTDQGAQMKMAGTYESYDWCSGGDCNKSGLGILPGGYNPGNGFLYLGGVGYCWSSTPSGGGGWYWEWTYDTGMVFRSVYSRPVGFSVRCVMN